MKSKKFINDLKEKDPKSWMIIGIVLIFIAVAGKLLLFLGIGILLFTLYLYKKKGDLKNGIKHKNKTKSS